MIKFKFIPDLLDVTDMGNVEKVDLKYMETEKVRNHGYFYRL